jgi:hypothetical protein
MQSSSGSWNESILHRFSQHADGGQPLGALFLSGPNTIYGVTNQGGKLPIPSGVVYELKIIP